MINNLVNILQEEKVRLVLEEMRLLFEENQKDV
jgi:hypothetical protein